MECDVTINIRTRKATTLNLRIIITLRMKHGVRHGNLRAFQYKEGKVDPALNSFNTSREDKGGGGRVEV
jgi:hypothetical protein